MRKTIKLTIMVDPDLGKRLARIAKERHCSGAQVIREWIRRAAEIEAALAITRRLGE